MKKGLLSIFIICGILLLTGCGNNEEKHTFCTDVEPVIENYKQDKISYDEFYSEIKTLYSKYCAEDTGTLCTGVKSDIASYDSWKKGEHDCTKYTGTLKSACEKSNELQDKMLREKTDATIMKTRCAK